MDGMKQMRILALALTLALPVFAQSANWMADTGDVSLSGAATKATVQQPSTGGEQIQLQSVQVYCSVACTITQSQNGTAATATAGTVRGLLPFTQTAFALTFFTASDVGSGTTTNVTVCAAACTLVFDLSSITMGNTGTGTNYSVGISSITGTARIQFLGKRL